MLFWFSIFGLVVFFIGLLLCIWLNWIGKTTPGEGGLIAAVLMLPALGAVLLGLLILVITGITKLILL